MKKLVVAIVVMLAFAATAQAEIPKFESLSDFALACESSFVRNNHNDRAHVWFLVKPGQNVVRMINDKSESFEFPIVYGEPSVAQVPNRFGHFENVPYATWIVFKDHGDKLRHLRISSGPESYIYAPSRGNNENWRYACIVVTVRS